jgi:hypothetical protein
MNKPTVSVAAYYIPAKGLKVKLHLYEQRTLDQAGRKKSLESSYFTRDLFKILFIQLRSIGHNLSIAYAFWPSPCHIRRADTLFYSLIKYKKTVCSEDIKA